MSYFIINTAVANVYREPSHDSAVVTQALMGETCQILDVKDKWYHIRQWDDYEGWIYYFHGIEKEYKYLSNMLLKDLFGTIMSSDEDKIINNLVFGNQVIHEQKHDRFQITLPDGRIGFSQNNFGEKAKTVNRDTIVKTTKQFFGTPYLWGGKSSYGMDCSGFVQTVFRANGIDLPRDAYQQADFFSNNIIDEDNIESGDLLFFGENKLVTHVAISTSGLNFINARGYVREESIDKKNPLFNRNLRDLFLYAVSINKFMSL